MPPIDPTKSTGMDAEPIEDDDPRLASKYASLGLKLFAVYTALYGAFVAFNAFAPGVMGRPAFGGLNLAVTSGIGLIKIAVLLSLLYMALCRRIATRHRAEGGR